MGGACLEESKFVDWVFVGEWGGEGERTKMLRYANPWVEWGGVRGGTKKRGRFSCGSREGN